MCEGVISAEAKVRGGEEEEDEEEEEIISQSLKIFDLEYLFIFFIDFE